MIYLSTNVKYDNILNNFEFEGSVAKVNVTVAYFRKKNNVIALAPSLWTNFAVTSHKCLV